MPGRNMDLSEGVGRKRNADDDSDSDDANFKRPRPAGNAEHDTKAIDSDDEDIDEKASTEKYDILQDDDVEGQEEGTFKVDEGVRITPFNIQEELEEGHFDTDGHYHFSKDKEVKDAWLDGLDQFADEDFEKKQQKKAEEAEAEAAAAPPVPSDAELYAILLSVMLPGETVAKALRRVGGAIRPVQRQKKGQKLEAASNEVDEAKEKFDKLTTAADTLLQKGHLETYQNNYEKLAFLSKKENERLAGMSVSKDQDIFGDDFDPSVASTSGSTTSLRTEAQPENSQTLWEYKWKNADEEAIHGPFSSEQMNEWVQQEFFKEGVFVRKAGAVDAPFYTSKRVDFDLYT